MRGDVGAGALGMITATFWSLAAAAACLWLPQAGGPGRPSRVWLAPAALALAIALAAGFADGRGLLVLAVLAGASHAAGHAPSRAVRIAAHLVVLVLTAALFLHLAPGFANPIVLDRVVLGPGAVPYSQYLNVDKGVAGLVLLGLYVPGLTARDELARHVAAFLWRFALVAGAVVALSLLVGYVRWDPKLPPWSPLWAGIMLVLTVLPEEAVFRGVIQTSLAARVGDGAAVVFGGLAFGLAHLAGGPLYVVAASAAGIGYGWIYASTRSIAAAILAHAGLNAIHFLFFTYPALAAMP